MSKFIEKLNQASQASPQPMGFSASKTASPKTAMLLVASLAEDNASSMVDYLTGADAVLLDISDLTSGTKTLKALCQKVPDIPCGGRVPDIDSAGIKRLIEAGCDFLVLPTTSASLAVLQHEEIGRILEVEASLSEGLIRTIDDLPVDAVIITDEREKGNLLTWRRLMVFQRFGSLVSKLLLAPLPVKTSTTELQAVWGTGVDGMIVKVSPEEPKDGLKELRQTIDKLTLPPSRKPAKTDAIIPRLGGDTRVPAEDEEEEEE